MSSARNREVEYLDALFSLTFSRAQVEEAVSLVQSLTPAERADFLSLADSHHVVVRALTPILERCTGNGHSELGTWAQEAMAKERGRISTALVYLQSICEDLEGANCPTT